MLTSLLLVSAVSGCATATSDYCLIAKPHTFNDKTIDAMTDEEVKQELVHNETYAKLCND